MHELNMEAGRVKVNMKAFEIGSDLCVIISGGEIPHIGCVTLSVPRPSLSDSKINSATTSILNLTGHKDDEAARYVSHTLSARLNKNVVVTCGIHLDKITPEEIETIINILNELTNTLILNMRDS